MSVNQVPGPFEREVQTIVETDEAYTLDNNVDIVDVIAESTIVVKLPPSPVAGQRHRVLSPLSATTLDGNGHSIADGSTTVAAGKSADLTFSGQAGTWVPSANGTHV